MNNVKSLILDKTTIKNSTKFKLLMTIYSRREWAATVSWPEICIGRSLHICVSILFEYVSMSLDCNSVLADMLKAFLDFGHFSLAILQKVNFWPSVALAI